MCSLREECKPGMSQGTQDELSPRETQDAKHGAESLAQELLLQEQAHSLAGAPSMSPASLQGICHWSLEQNKAQCCPGGWGAPLRGTPLSSEPSLPILAGWVPAVITESLIHRSLHVQPPIGSN